MQDERYKIEFGNGGGGVGGGAQLRWAQQPPPSTEVRSDNAYRLPAVSGATTVNPPFRYILFWFLK